MVSSLHLILTWAHNAESFPPRIRLQSQIYSGNKTGKRSSNPSGVLSRKLDRPDMLLFSGGATVLVGEAKVSMNVWQLCSISALVTVLMQHSGLSDV